LCARGAYQTAVHGRSSSPLAAVETITLYRPVGPAELELIRRSGFRSFPPRLPEQQIFYPVTNQEYATQIARDWNVKADGAGYVTRFQVLTSYLSRFPIQTVGSSVHTEYWIPAEDLAEFNSNLVGLIEVIEQFPSVTSIKGS
jgi:hypothetical protein